MNGLLKLMIFVDALFDNVWSRNEVKVTIKFVAIGMLIMFTLMMIKGYVDAL